ncbi:MAG: hypothetical protein AAF223_20050, partial [Bacteroidota bacterium]
AKEKPPEDAIIDTSSRRSTMGDTEVVSEGSAATTQGGNVVPNNQPAAGQKISEAGYQQRIERLESLYGTNNVHSLEKHGAQTKGLKQYRRVQQPRYPNPTTGAPGNATKTASKFLTMKTTTKFYVKRSCNAKLTQMFMTLTSHWIEI